MEKVWLQLQSFNFNVINAILKRPRCKQGRARDWLQLQNFNFSVINALLKGPRCKRGRERE